MRFLAAVVGLLLLAGCDSGTQSTSATGADAADKAEAFVNTGSGFDYRYAFRVRGDRLKAVLQSNADGCDKLGPARCRITHMRYSVDNGNKSKAVLTFMIDPSIARRFGEAAVKTLTSADGLLTDSELSGPDSTATARSLAMVDRLRDQLKSAKAQSESDSNARARAERIQTALDTIAEVEASQGQTLATSPVLITYESSGALNGLGSASADFRMAGKGLETSVARVLVVLAAIGPWLLVLIVIVLVLRLIVHGPGGGRVEAEPEDEDYREQREEPRRDNRNLIHRWFNRDDDREPERE